MGCPVFAQGGTGMRKVFPDEKVHRNSLWGSLLAISETIKRSSATCNADGVNRKAEDLGSLSVETQKIC